MGLDWSGSERYRIHLAVVRGVMGSILPPAEDPFAETLSSLVLDARGKMLRPLLVLLGARAEAESSAVAGFRELAVPGCTEDEAFAAGRALGAAPGNEALLTGLLPGALLFPGRVYLLAAALELLHTATLVHDDIIDRAEKRRGLPTLHTLGGHRRAILAGDYLFSSSLMLISPWLSGMQHADAGRALQLLCRGEMLQARAQDRAIPSKRLYKRQIAGKTAMLFVLACRGGATLMAEARRPALARATAPHGEAHGETQIARMLGVYAYGLGMAFQINDDLLDYFPGDAGSKTAFRDYNQGLLTLPLILGLEDDLKGELHRFIERHIPGKKDLSPRQEHTLTVLLTERKARERACLEAQNYLLTGRRQVADTKSPSGGIQDLDALAARLLPELAGALPRTIQTS